MKRITVVALGGNALLRGSETGTIQQQEKNTYDTCKNLINIINKDYGLVITHGNGPQIGNILLRNEAGYESYKIPKMPIDICVADSQGGIGYMIERQMKNILRENKIRKNVITIVTEVLVDINDQAFKEPTKPVGKYYLKEEADLLARANNWMFTEDSRKRGWRRIVASPKPIDILGKKIIKDLVSKGNIVIAVGGGGVPVYLDQNKNLQGIEAVIDKDLASSLLATEIGAECLYILTDVPKVYINFHKPNQMALDKLNVDDAKKYYDEEQFSAGSMGPKILSAISFLINGGKECIITEASELNNPKSGTVITK
ncbi:MAG: carbamate kinase [Ignavibacteria bacterium RIFOXYB2_FULL_35_12]|nr:MAG: carbamate kinase [Ignavibacteria bacterium GWA2_36_19]OGU60931.1 MAG: carbamate kinase [Ignavibacteria bacterium GWF2_35_20]OGU83263.1 MAG: carbamate kinase [Ignavibacteria bacterium RIFOXYA2_FULL_35_9]OGU83965.1 MAG: carbamate kinase [Ignavibacteria bacterium RIFOXYA12_FULL_35_25]OGU92526.1 MAG: carbamate kinase [Ignavibacteria bacterium RIFOXYC12_FULL_35_11]OGU93459.1 MAG: carbamate kinase [Ignavibacteria bacterium RIFOXYB12_FULL_35_14]OGV00818.1 MAG: carbamate kinase [Ignavibacteri